ncbi:hypothetical protein BBJ28_00025377 [Nothophytophthora sp. Chile5]|nr:hypothetical protein BBJ28_00025377 [Nothophytophthora sp. Chile5]
MSNYPQGRAMQQRLPGYPPGPTPNGMDVNGGGNMRMPLNPMPLMSEAAPMGYPSVPPPSSGAPNAYQGGDSSAEYVNFVAANDPQLPPSGDTYYDANGTTYRGVSDFEVDTSGTTLSSAANPVPSTAITADVDTEPESPSMSQATTPAQSDTDGERSEADRQRDREEQLASLTAASNALQSSSSTAPAATAVTTIAQPSEGSSSLDPSLSQTHPALAAVDGSSSEMPSAAIPDESVAGTEAAVPERKPPIGQDVDTSGDAATARRSSRVSRKITTNIADMYDPEFVKLQGRQVGAGSGSEAGLEDATSGEVGELATELLEEFHATIRPLKPDVPRSLLLLRAQLLTMEAAIPRDAFRSGRWGRAIRVAWAEMVYSCASAATLMEAVVFLEFNLEAEWLDPCWKASPLQTAKNALATATIASAAMRLYALDDAITYGRMKRGGKRKHKAPSSASSSRPNSPTRSAIITQEKKATGPISHPSELPFMRTLSAGVTALANKMIHRILAGQRDRTLTTYASRKVKSELMAITSLTEAQVEQWVQVVSSLANHPSTSRGGLSISTSGLPPSSGQSGANGRHTTPKRKHPGSQAPAPLAGQRLSSTRKRRAPSPPPSVASPAPMESETQSVKLRCFQMKTPTHRFPNGGGQDTTLRPRLEYIVGILLRNELALAFSAPVNSDDVPGYAELIKHPMDLGTIKTHLSRGLYDQRFELVVRDVNLVWENCFTFNRLDADISNNL